MRLFINSTTLTGARVGIRRLRMWPSSIRLISPRQSIMSRVEQRACLNLKSIRGSIGLDDGPLSMTKEYQKTLDDLLHYLSQALADDRHAENGARIQTVQGLSEDSRLMDGIIGALNRDIGVNFRSQNISQQFLAACKNSRLLEIKPFSADGIISFDRKKSNQLYVPTTEFFREAMDRLMVTFNLRSWRGRRQLIDLMFTEALLMRFKRKLSVEKDEVEDGKAEITSDKDLANDKIQQDALAPSVQLLQRLNVGIHPDLECSIQLPPRLDQHNPTDVIIPTRIQGRIDYLTTPHFNRSEQSEKPDYLSRALCAVHVIDPQDKSMLSQFHANHLQWQIILHACNKSTMLYRPLNVCLTDGFRWQFFRIYPHHNSMCDANMTAGEWMCKYPDNSSPNTDSISDKLTLADHSTIRKMFNYSDLRSQKDFSCVKVDERRTGDALFQFSCVYDLLANDGQLVLGILQWWLRGLMPPRDTFTIGK